MKIIIKNIVIFTILLTVLACGKKEVSNNSKINFKEVKTVPANFTQINKIAVFSGSIDSINEMGQTTVTGGDVIKINYKNGDRVKVGDVILILDDQNTKSAYLESKAKLISEKSDYDTQKTSFNKYKILYGEKLISEDEYLNVKNRLSSSEGNYKSAEAAYLENKKNYNDLTVKAKINGTVANLDLKLFNKTQPNALLFKIVDNDNLRVVGGVSSNNIIGLKNGAIADIYVEGSKTAIKGVLYEINPIASLETRQFQVKIKINNKNSQLKQGMFAKVELRTGKKEGVSVPQTAIIIENLYSYIFIVEPTTIDITNSGKVTKESVLVAKKIKVKLGIAENTNQEVISSELKKKNRVVVSGQYSLNDGDYVKEEK